MNAPLKGAVGLVVLASDFSPGARRALHRVQHLPLAASAEVVVVHVPAAHAQPGGERSAIPDRLDKEVGALRLALSRRERSDVVVRGSTLHGSPAVAISTFACESSASLVAMGRRGGGGVRRLLLGSTAERVAHLSNVPVLVVRDRPQGAYGTPLVALAPEESARVVMDGALRVLEGTARIEALAAAYIPMEDALWSGGLPSEETIRLRELVRRRTEAALRNALSDHQNRGSKTRLTIVNGDPREVILTVAGQKKADLLVVGTGEHPISLFRHVGSVSAHVLRHALCDVLVVPTPTSRPVEFRDS